MSQLLLVNAAISSPSSLLWRSCQAKRRPVAAASRDLPRLDGRMAPVDDDEASIDVDDARSTKIALVGDDGVARRHVNGGDRVRQHLERALVVVDVSQQRLKLRRQRQQRRRRRRQHEADQTSSASRSSA